MSTTLQRSLSAALEHARASGKPALGVVSWALAGAIEPTRAFELLREDVEATPLLLWARGGEWALAAGALEQVVSRGPGRFEALEAARRRWAAQSGDHAAYPMWSGLAFDEELRGGEWAAWGAARAVLPAMVLRGDAAQAQCMVAGWVAPNAALAPLTEQWQARVDAVVAFAEVVAGAGRVSRETSRGEVIVREEPHVARWAGEVDALGKLFGSGLQKVVLARPIALTLDAPIDHGATLASLRARYPQCATYGVSLAPGLPTLVGATPETLARVVGEQVFVDALAGSAPTKTPHEAFLASDKDRREHDLVVQAIRRALEPIAALCIPDAPVVDALPNILHLRTPIAGALKSPMSALEVGARLHPTPAICGQPLDAARRFIREVEGSMGFERGWYAGALGWSTLDGDGELVVTLRCGTLREDRARLFVGAGMVAGSRGDLEVQETRIKARPVEEALRVVTHGGAS